MARASLATRPVRETVAAALGCLGEEFTPDSVAYLALTSKDERLLCGALARHLHGEFGDDAEMLVRQEWSVPGDTRKRVDVAVLRTGKPVALIEAKAAMMSFDLVKGTGRGFPASAVLEDIRRLRRIDVAAERFALLFVANTKQLLSDEYDPALPYAEERRRHGVIDEPRMMGRVQAISRSSGPPSCCGLGPSGRRGRLRRRSGRPVLAVGGVKATGRGRRVASLDLRFLWSEVPEIEAHRAARNALFLEREVTRLSRLLEEAGVDPHARGREIALRREVRRLRKAVPGAKARAAEIERLRKSLWKSYDDQARLRHLLHEALRLHDKLKAKYRRLRAALKRAVTAKDGLKARLRRLTAPAAADADLRKAPGRSRRQKTALNAAAKEERPAAPDRGEAAAPDREAGDGDREAARHPRGAVQGAARAQERDARAAGHRSAARPRSRCSRPRPHPADGH